MLGTIIPQVGSQTIPLGQPLTMTRWRSSSGHLVALNGRPLGFSPLPDFSAVLDDPDDLEAAVSMAAGSLFDATGASKGAGSVMKMGILTGGIRYFAKHGGKTLPELVNFFATFHSMHRAESPKPQSWLRRWQTLYKPPFSPARRSCLNWAAIASQKCLVSAQKKPVYRW